MPLTTPGATTSVTTKFMAVLPFVQWVWAGAFCTITGLGAALYSLKTESLAARSDITNLQSVVASQDKRLDEQLKILNSIHAEQVKLNENIKNLNQNFADSIKNTNDRVDYILDRLDKKRGH